MFTYCTRSLTTSHSHMAFSMYMAFICPSITVATTFTVCAQRIEGICRVGVFEYDGRGDMATVRVR